jgi:sugar phosphate isomerase/epimerase
MWRMNDTAMTRRGFVKCAAISSAALASATTLTQAADEPAAATLKRKFRFCLSCGPIGVPGNPRQEIEWASRFGFEAVEPAPSFLSQLSDVDLRAYLGELKTKNLALGAAGLPTQFRADDIAFDKDMKTLPGFAKTLQRAGVTRVATWLSPTHRSLTYVAHFRLHARRLREVAGVLGDHGVRLGLEYVGPKTSWTSNRFPFLHTMAEMKDLIAEINRDNVGFLLDSWHWHTAQEGEADLLTLQNKDVVLCHLNDAPKGISTDQQIDSRRDLPCATGVIDLKSFLGAMVKIGYDGPVVCEPFCQDLKRMTPDQILEAVATALKRAAALVE